MEKEKSKKQGNKFLILIRITGRVGMRRKVAETLSRLRLRRKYSCTVLVNPKKEQIGMLKKVYDLVAFGEISEAEFVKLLEARAQLVDKSKKVDLKDVPKKLLEGKKYSELNLKPFFRLHPPRGGIDTKKHFGKKKGVLGNHGEEINKLLERML